MLFEIKVYRYGIESSADGVVLDRCRKYSRRVGFVEAGPLYYREINGSQSYKNDLIHGLLAFPNARRTKLKRSELLKLLVMIMPCYINVGRS